MDTQFSKNRLADLSAKHNSLIKDIISIIKELLKEKNITEDNILVITETPIVDIVNQSLESISMIVEKVYLTKDDEIAVIGHEINCSETPVYHSSNVLYSHEYKNETDEGDDFQPDIDLTNLNFYGWESIAEAILNS